MTYTNKLGLLNAGLSSDSSHTFYVYRHIRLDTNTPFYVGKGRGRRAFRNSKRNKYWNNIVNKHGYEIEIIIEGLSEDQAFEKEIEFIKMYKDLGYCEANMTEGGEGSTGYKPTQETLKNMSRARTGIKLSKSHRSAISEGLKGRIVTKEMREKIGNGNRGLIKFPNGRKFDKEFGDKIALSKGLPFIVYDFITGEYVGEWFNQSQCARDLNIKSPNICLCLKKPHKHKYHRGYGFIYKELGDDIL